MAIFLKTPLILIGNDDLARVSRDNPGYRFEREADGTIIVSPTHTKGGVISLEAAVQLYSYAKAAGGKAYDSSTGFAIGPGERVYSPDAAWVSQPRIDAIKATGDAGFWPLSPDVIIVNQIPISSRTRSQRSNVSLNAAAAMRRQSTR